MFISDALKNLQSKNKNQVKDAIEFLTVYKELLNSKELDILNKKSRENIWENIVYLDS